MLDTLIFKDLTVDTFCNVYLRLKPQLVRAVLYNRAQHYTSFPIPKSNGHVRVLRQPSSALKNIQKKLLKFFEEVAASNNPKYFYFKHSRHAHGFVKEKGILSHAAIHQGQKYILRVDLQDFFPSITFGRVLGLFQKLGFSRSVSILIANICCDPIQPLSIPQGAPTSPFISNLLVKRLDKRVYALARKWHVRYSRYADDLTFSHGSHFEYKDFVSEVNTIVNSEHFSINQDKTLWMPYSQRQMITGIIVNDGFNLPRRYIKSLQSALYHCKKNSVLKAAASAPYSSTNLVEEIQELLERRTDSSLTNEQTQRIKEIEKHYIRHLQGKLDFYNQVITYNTRGLAENELLSACHHVAYRRYNCRKKILDKMLTIFYSLPQVSIQIKQKSFTQPQLQYKGQTTALEQCTTTKDLEDFIERYKSESLHMFLLSNHTETDFEVLQNLIREKINKPNPILQTNVLYILEQKNSTEGVLGPLTHERAPKEDFLEWFKGQKAQKHFMHPKLFDAFLETFSEFHKLQLTSRLPLTQERLDEALAFKKRLKTHKEQLRYASGSEFTNLDEKHLQTIFQKAQTEENSPITLNVIQLCFHQIKTFTPIIDIALGLIFKGMRCHNNNGKLFIDINQFNKDETQMDYTRICIFDKQPAPIMTHPSRMSRHKLAGGHLKTIIETLYGLCTYSVICHFTDHGPKQIFMFEDRPPEAPPPTILKKSPNGFFHIIDIPDTIEIPDTMKH